MSKRYSGKSFKDSREMKKPKLSFKKKGIKNEFTKSSYIFFSFNSIIYINFNNNILKIYE